MLHTDSVGVSRSLPVCFVAEKGKPEPRGSGSRELHDLSSYKKIIASWAPEINVTKIVVIPSAWFWREESAVFPWAEMRIPPLRLRSGSG